MALLGDHFAQLDFRIGTEGIRPAAHAVDHREFGPDEQSGAVAGIEKHLAVRIVGTAHGVGADFNNHRHVLALLCVADGP